MKKLLATLLVALMVMSCMTVVSFAAVGDGTTEFYTYAAAPSAEYDAAMASYYTELVMLDAVPTSYGPGDYVIFPIMFRNNTGINAFQYEIIYDDNVLTPEPDFASLYTDFEGQTFNADPSNKNADGDSAIMANFYITNTDVAKTFGNAPVLGSGMNKYIATDGCLQLALFVVKDGVDNVTTDVTFKITEFKAVSAKGAQPTTYTANVTTEKMTLTIGTPVVETPKMEESDVAAMETSKKVFAPKVSTYAEFLGAFNSENIVETGSYDAETMTYVAAFGTVDTTKEADEYGFKLTTSYGKVIKGKAQKQVSGQFGIVFYGADYVLEGATIEAYAIVDGQEI